MLSDEEEQALADIEARLHADSPHLAELFAAVPGVGGFDGPPLDDRAPTEPSADRTTPLPDDLAVDLSGEGAIDPGTDLTAEPTWLDDLLGDDPRADPPPRRGAGHPTEHLHGAAEGDRPPVSPAASVTARLLLVLAALAGAILLTAAVTLVAGPNAGGLIGAASIPLAGLYGWSLFGCPRRT